MAGQIWDTDNLGGFFANEELSKRLRHAAQPMMKFRQFVDAEPAAGQSRGDTVLFNKISNVNVAGAALTEGTNIPQNNYTIQQGTLTVTEYGNSIPMSLKVKTLSEINVDDSIKVVLRNDMAKVLDSFAAAEYQLAKNKAVCTDVSTTVFVDDGTPVANAGANMSDKNVRDVVDKLKLLNVPRYDGNNFIAIHSVNSIRGIYDFFESKAQETTMGPLFAGEVGTYYGTRHVEENNVLSNTIGTGSAFGESVFFGADAVREGIVIPENVRIDIPTDFGRNQAIAWYYLGGFVKTWDQTVDGEARIVHVTSA